MPARIIWRGVPLAAISMREFPPLPPTSWPLLPPTNSCRGRRLPRTSGYPCAGRSSGRPSWACPSSASTRSGAPAFVRGGRTSTAGCATGPPRCEPRCRRGTGARPDLAPARSRPAVVGRSRPGRTAHEVADVGRGARCRDAPSGCGLLVCLAPAPPRTQEPGKRGHRRWPASRAGREGAPPVAARLSRGLGAAPGRGAGGRESGCHVADEHDARRGHRRRRQH